MPKSLIDYAMDEFAPRAKAAVEAKEKSDDAELEKRRSYYYSLIDKEHSGQALSDKEKDWLKTARASIQPRGPDDQKYGSLSGLNTYEKAYLQNTDSADRTFSGKAATDTERKAASLVDSADTKDETAVQLFNNGVVRGAMREGKRDKNTHLLPNAPAYQPLTQPTLGDGSDEVVAIDEMGRSITGKGKNVGYQTKPAVVTPYGDVPLRTGERRPTDNVITKDKGLMGNDATSQQWLEQSYGEHLKAMEDNRDENGMPTDQFPSGYFDGMSKAQRNNIEYGVKALRSLNRGTRT